MSTFHEEDTEIQRMVNQAPMGADAPEGLKRALRTMAATTKVRKASRWPAVLAFAGVGATAIVVATLTMMPSHSFASVVQATENANTFQLSIVSHEDGQNNRVVIAFANGKFGLRAENGGLMQFSSGKMEFYDPKDNTVTELSLGGMVDPSMMAGIAKESMSAAIKEMDLKKMLGDFEAKYGKENIRVGPIQHRFGKSTYDVDLQKPGEPEQVHMTVNADNNLPEHIEISKRGEDGSFHPDSEIDVKFGGAVDIDFSAEFPKDAKRIQLDLSKFIPKGIEGMKGMPNMNGFNFFDKGDKTDKDDGEKGDKETR